MTFHTLLRPVVAPLFSLVGLCMLAGCSTGTLAPTSAPVPTFVPTAPATLPPPTNSPPPTIAPTETATPAPPTSLPGLTPTSPPATNSPVSVATSTPQPTTALPTYTPIVLGQDVLVVYEESSCFAGIKELLIVHQGGLVEWTDVRRGIKKELQLDHPALLPLQNLLSDPQYAQLQSDYQQPGADQCVYAVTSTNAQGQTRTITTVDGATNPPILSQVIAILEQLRQQAQGQ